jgi:hypothetical protein
MLLYSTKIIFFRKHYGYLVAGLQIILFVATLIRVIISPFINIDRSPVGRWIWWDNIVNS